MNNCGNFKSFGDSKFVPECSHDSLKKFFLLSSYWSNHQEEFCKIYDRIEKFIFTYDKPYGLLDFSDKEGTTGYYSGNISTGDAEKVKEVTVKRGLMSENNRLVKISENEFILKVASIEPKEEIIEENGLKLTIRYGEFAPFLKLVNQYLAES